MELKTVQQWHDYYKHGINCYGMGNQLMTREQFLSFIITGK